MKLCRSFEDLSPSSTVPKLDLQAKAKETRRDVWGSLTLDESGEQLASGGTPRQYVGVGAGKGAGGQVTAWIIIW